MIDFPKQDDHSEDEKQEKEHVIHASSLSPQENRSLFQKFKAVAVHLFSSWQDPKADQLLTGRIHALQNKAKNVLDELTQIKEDLEREADPDLVGSIEAVVKPIVRDVQRIQRKSVDPKSVAEKKDAAESYSKWIDRASPWVHLLASNLKDKHAIIQAVVKYTIHSSEEMVKRDLQIIKDYQQHKLDEITKDNGERIQLQERLNQALSRHLEDLARLQRSEPAKPDEISLKELEAWKERVESLREKLYNKSLHIIDDVFRETHPVEESKDVHEHVLANLNRIAVLEEAIVHLQSDMNKHVLEEDEIFNKLDQYEKETHLFINDIQLTPELAERIFKAKYALVEVRERLQKFD